jgi:hypothetical protein
VGGADVRTAAVAAHVAYFTLASVESFERHMEEAQQALGRDPSRFVPIVYTSETPILSILGNFLPTLLFIGALLFMSQRAASQVGLHTCTHTQRERERERDGLFLCAASYSHRLSVNLCWWTAGHRWAAVGPGACLGWGGLLPS